MPNLEEFQKEFHQDYTVILSGEEIAVLMGALMDAQDNWTTERFRADNLLERFNKLFPRIAEVVQL